jgi:hypothetical protein
MHYFLSSFCERVHWFGLRRILVVLDLGEGLYLERSHSCFQKMFLVLITYFRLCWRERWVVSVTLVLSSPIFVNLVCSGRLVATCSVLVSGVLLLSFSLSISCLLLLWKAGRLNQELSPVLLSVGKFSVRAE